MTPQAIPAAPPAPPEAGTAVRSPIADAVQELNNALSSTVVAIATQANDARTARRWASGDRTPSVERERAIYFLLELVRYMRTTESDDAIRAWINNYNIGLNAIPALLLRDHPTEDVAKRILDAAKLLVEAPHV